MCLPVAVPAHPRILAGRRFLRISGNRGVAGFPGDPILSTQRIPRGRDPIFPTQRIGAAGIRFYLHKRDILKNFPAARASKARNSYKN